MLVIVAGYSRWITARILPSTSAADLIAGHSRLLTEMSAVPRMQDLRGLAAAAGAPHAGTAGYPNVLQRIVGVDPAVWTADAPWLASQRIQGGSPPRDLSLVGLRDSCQ